MARPTLSTFLNEPAFFSSGDILTAGIAGNTGGSVITIPTGIIVKITPLKLDEEGGDQYVTFEVEIESSLAPTPAEGGLTAQVLKFTKTKMHTTLRLKFNETGQIGGLYGRSSVSNKEGIPFLSDIPILNLLTSNESTINIKTSVLFLITPRKRAAVERTTKKAFLKKQEAEKQRKNLPSLQEWLDGKAPLYKSEPALRNILESLAPKNANEFYRRGDVLPINSEAKDRPSFQDEVAPLSFFFS